MAFLEGSTTYAEDSQVGRLIASSRNAVLYAILAMQVIGFNSTHPRMRSLIVSMHFIQRLCSKRVRQIEIRARGPGLSGGRGARGHFTMTSDGPRCRDAK